MGSIVIHGPSIASGNIRLAGNKNAALPMIAAAMMTDEPVILHNVPDILDVRNMLRIAEDIGASVQFSDNTLRIDASSVHSAEVSRIYIRDVLGL